MIYQSMCLSFKLGLMNGVHDLTNDIIKVALYTSAANLSGSTTVYSTTGEVSGVGYEPGGLPLIKLTPTIMDGIAVMSFSDLTWPVTTITARGALIYNASKSNAAMMVLDFGFDKTTDLQPFTIRFPAFNATDAIMRIA